LCPLVDPLHHNFILPSHNLDAVFSQHTGTPCSSASLVSRSTLLNADGLLDTLPPSPQNSPSSLLPEHCLQPPQTPNIDLSLNPETNLIAFLLNNSELSVSFTNPNIKPIITALQMITT